ncbi:MAG: hypothetical protein G3M70_11965 [Candidatus Nitronauta litoralis]|uniref:Uncharacterized protein n=1 Tax=Candidatus Nitronauta litoralis TaxID=2705533 RepID=A0A7T0BX90_9BACT|nr:MAG: hypothetical protein G3M70_11965 [Candidatus Nitronauta litoralis]
MGSKNPEDDEIDAPLTEKQKKDVISVYAAVIAVLLIAASFVWNFLAALPWK